MSRGGRPVGSCGTSHPLGDVLVMAAVNAPRAKAAIAASSVITRARFIDGCEQQWVGCEA